MLSDISVQASIWPISRSRTITGSVETETAV
jgi:hypothetical protein